MRPLRLVVLVVLVVVVGVGACSSAVNRKDSDVKAAALLVVDVTAPPPKLAPLDVTLNPRPLRGHKDTETVALDSDGLDAIDDDLPFVRFDDGGVAGHWRVPGTIGGQRVRITVDSGAERSLIASALANELGLARAHDGHMRDASGAVVDVDAVALPDVVVGGVVFRGIRAVVPKTSIEDGLVLLGQDALNHVDTVVDAVIGAIAFVEPGVDVARVGEDAAVAELDVTADRWNIVATAVGTRGPVSFPFSVDTGSQVTAVPAALGIEAGLPADVSRSVELKGAAGVAVERRGRFWLSPLTLGLVSVGDVAAIETPAESGLIGTDVLGRGRVLFSPARRAAVFFAADAHAGARVIDNVDDSVDDTAVVAVKELAVDGDFEVTSTLKREVHLLLRAHDRYSNAPTGGAVDVVISAAGRYRIETRLHFGSQAWSYLLLPPTGRPCATPCLKRVGEWAPTKQTPGPPVDWR